jgi:LAS superfamily LD-carboxypeptidase LdcB
VAAPAAARTTAPAANPTAATTSVAAGYPTDLSAYGNGRIPTTALKPLGVGDHRLWAPAADNFRAMKAHAARDGVSIGINDSYRSYAEQVDMARRKGLYSQGGLAAAPGTSEHGLGKSLDLQLDTRALSWMRAHADEYGFSNNVPRESWHWTYTRRS